eukprot:CAMPEP_0167772096 /NCGR_PEP_ID=MMETSP0111_2-20121227/654_1 /TAXON_ID=91324 /ORGANISM="Lotharella globosa, Strain CCCM811" /LENGTH=500 /DNA_ID=CAMNT_0007661543 /DNA_START=13 /DNA_END=1515 /DNA_ORIENTATION=+
MPMSLGFPPGSLSGPWVATTMLGKRVGHSKLMQTWSSEALLQPVHEFDCIVIVDLEATCDEGSNPKVTQGAQEIIEFPWILVDLKAPGGPAICDRQQRYVRPVMNKTLTPFCRGLTGISQSDVDKAPELKDVVDAFAEYMRALTMQGKTCALLADGEWDFKVLLQSEAKRKNLSVPSYFRSFFDLRSIFTKFKGMQRPSLKRMLTACGLDFEGKHHHGMDDCNNIARIALALVTDGYRFRKIDLSKFPESYDPMKDPFVKDFNRNGSNQPYRAPFTHPDRVVRIRGLPWKATVQDVERFFTPLPLASKPQPIQLTKDSLGRPSGCGFVEFGNREAAQWAIKTCHKRYLMNRYIEVFPLAEKDEKPTPAAPKENKRNNQPNTSGTEKKTPTSKSSTQSTVRDAAENKKTAVGAIGSNNGASTSSSVRLRGLPWSATTEDIIKFFEPLQLANGSAIQLMKNKRGRPSGLAIVEFATMEDAQQATKEYHKKYMGKRYIEVHPI